MENKLVDMSEQTSQRIYSITKLNGAEIGITIPEEAPCLILI